MDESIYGVDDIDRAAAMKGCGFVKLKIAKMTGLDMLADGLRRIRELGLTPVLGNGAGPDAGCWIEACVAHDTIDNAGENCGFLKIREQLLETPLTFEDGAIVLQPGFQARFNHDGGRAAQRRQGAIRHGGRHGCLNAADAPSIAIQSPEFGRVVQCRDVNSHRNAIRDFGLDLIVRVRRTCEK